MACAHQEAMQGFTQIRGPNGLQWGLSEAKGEGREAKRAKLALLITCL